MLKIALLPVNIIHAKQTLRATAAKERLDTIRRSAGVTSQGMTELGREAKEAGIAPLGCLGATAVHLVAFAAAVHAGVTLVATTAPGSADHTYGWITRHQDPDTTALWIDLAERQVATVALALAASVAGAVANLSAIKPEMTLEQRRRHIVVAAGVPLVLAVFCSFWPAAVAAYLLVSNTAGIGTSQIAKWACRDETDAAESKTEQKEGRDGQDRST